MNKILKLSIFLIEIILFSVILSCKNITYYTVFFDSNGGSPILNQTIESGKTAIKPADPTRSSTETTIYTFDGWYIDSTFLNRFDFSTPITADIILYAKWIEEKDNNCYLKTIDFSCGFLSPDFDKDTYDYVLFIPWNIDEKFIEIMPTTESSKATVTEKYKKELYYIPDSEYTYFTVTAENSMTKTYSIKISRYNSKVVFSYNWSLDTKQITITNLSKQKSYFILATSTPIINENNEHDFALIEINEELKPSETKILNACEPTYLTNKPTIIFSTDKGSIFEYSGDFIEYLFLDYKETYTGEIKEFSDMYSISDREDKYGDYSTFSWIDRNKGQYQIVGRETKKLMKAYIGNITAVTNNGDSTWLKAIRYYVGEKTEWLEWKNINN